MGTLGEAYVPPASPDRFLAARSSLTMLCVAHCGLTSIVISRFLLNLWEYDRSCLPDTTPGSHLTSLRFQRSRDPGEETDSFLGASVLESAAEHSSFYHRLVEFMDPLGAPVGGFLGEFGLGREDGYERVAYIPDVEELWRDVSKRWEYDAGDVV